MQIQDAGEYDIRCIHLLKINTSSFSLSLTNFASELKHLFGRSDISIDSEYSHCNGMTGDADGRHKIDYDLSRRLCPLLSSCLDCRCPFSGQCRLRLESFFLRGPSQTSPPPNFGGEGSFHSSVPVVVSTRHQYVLAYSKGSWLS